jgi:Lhr-like helicase
MLRQSPIAVTPPDVLLTTPESLEAVLISLKVEHASGLCAGCLTS